MGVKAIIPILAQLMKLSPANSPKIITVTVSMYLKMIVKSQIRTSL